MNVATAKRMNSPKAHTKATSGILTVQLFRAMKPESSWWVLWVKRGMGDDHGVLGVEFSFMFELVWRLRGLPQ